MVKCPECECDLSRFCSCRCHFKGRIKPERIDGLNHLVELLQDKEVPRHMCINVAKAIQEKLAEIAKPRKKEGGIIDKAIRCWSKQILEGIRND